MPRRQRGVTLIELMVGVVIGLLATLVIAQVSSVFEARRRQTVGGSDTQLTGALALNTLQRDVQMGGYGLTSGGLTTGGAERCTEIRGRRNGTEYRWPMAPVLITQGGGGSSSVTGRSDTVRVLMASNNNRYAVPMRLQNHHRRDATSFDLIPNTNVGNRLGDLLVAVPAIPGIGGQASPTWCSLLQISADPNNNTDTLEHLPNGSGPWNQDATATVLPGALNADIAYAASINDARGSFLINVGTLTDRCYFVSDPDTTNSDQRCGLAADASETPYTLRLRSFNTTTTVTSNQDLFPNVINLQALYGVASASASRTIDSWTTDTPTTSVAWDRVIAVRVGILARSTQYETDEVTTARPTWMPDGTTAQQFTLPSCPVGENDCWKHYRYRVFESVIPLRNMLWQALH
jgi:type IV pilus assembly protein PilW